MDSKIAINKLSAQVMQLMEANKNFQQMQAHPAPKIKDLIAVSTNSYITFKALKLRIKIKYIKFLLEKYILYIK